MQAIKAFRWLCRLSRVSTDCHDQHTKYKPSKLVLSETHQRSLHSHTKLISSGFDDLTSQSRNAYPRRQWNQGRSTVKVGHCIDVICVCSESPSLFCYVQVFTHYEASFRVSRFSRGKVCWGCHYLLCYWSLPFLCDFQFILDLTDLKFSWQASVSTAEVASVKFPSFLPRDVELLREPVARNMAARIQHLPVEVM